MNSKQWIDYVNGGKSEKMYFLVFCKTIFFIFE